MKLLVTSDLHIGRIPSLPEGEPPLTGRSAWEAVVDCALEQGVAALLLAGDAVEQDNAFFEATGALLQGLERLARAGIQVIAVAGNHDAKVFPRVARTCPALTLLGEGGRWETRVLGTGPERLRLVGWSFPAAHHPGNPLADFPTDLPADGLARLGLLHCDLEGPAASGYAPVPVRDLARAPIALWMLGHVHLPGPRAGANAYYCGSPFALDAAEEGPHGPWLLEVDPQGHLRQPLQLTLSPHQYRGLEVDLDGATGLAEVEDHIARTAREAGAGAAAEGLDGALHLKLRLTGRSALAGTLGPLLRDRLGSLSWTAQGLRVRVLTPVIDQTRPLLELAAKALQPGPSGRLAQLLVRLEADPADPEILGLLRDLEEADRLSFAAGAFGALPERPLAASDLRDLLRLAGLRLLEALPAAGAER